MPVAHMGSLSQPADTISAYAAGASFAASMCTNCPHRDPHRNCASPKRGCLDLLELTEGEKMQSAKKMLKEKTSAAFEVTSSAATKAVSSAQQPPPVTRVTSTQGHACTQGGWRGAETRPALPTRPRPGRPLVRKARRGRGCAWSPVPKQPTSAITEPRPPRPKPPGSYPLGKLGPRPARRRGARSSNAPLLRTQGGLQVKQRQQ